MPSFKEIYLQLHLTLNRIFLRLHFLHMYIEIFIPQKARFNQFIARYTFEKQLNGISFGFFDKGSIFNACHYMIMIFFSSAPFTSLLYFKYLSKPFSSVHIHYLCISILMYCVNFFFYILQLYFNCTNKVSM